jgi:hypothetical protein
MEERTTSTIVEVTCQFESPSTTMDMHLITRSPLGGCIWCWVCSQKGN